MPDNIVEQMQPFRFYVSKKKHFLCLSHHAFGALSHTPESVEQNSTPESAKLPLLGLKPDVLGPEEALLLWIAKTQIWWRESRRPMICSDKDPVPLSSAASCAVTSIQGSGQKMQTVVFWLLLNIQER